MVCLYWETYNAYYYSSLFSISAFITIVSVIVLLLLPFFLQFSTINEKFWYTTSTYYEHPVIRFNDEYVVSINYLIDDTSYNLYFTPYSQLNQFYTTNGDFNDIFINSIIIEKEEVNNDNVIDSLNLKMNLIKSSSVKITDIKIILFLDYILQSNVKYQFQTICLIDGFSSNGISQLVTNGRLKLRQKLPFKMTDFFNMTYSTNYFLTHGYFGSDFKSIYENFTFGRDYSTQYEYIYKNILPDSGSNTLVDINSIIEIPSYQEVIFGMPSYMNLKFKWITYLAAFIPTYIIIWYYLNFFFKNRIANVSVQGDLPKTIN